MNDKTRGNNFHTIKKFDDFFKDTFPLYINSPETKCEELKGIFTELKSNLFKKGKLVELDKDTVLYRARKAFCEELAYCPNDELEVRFWDDYMHSYFSNKKGTVERRKFIAEQCGYAHMSEWAEIREALSNGYLGYNKDKSGAPPVCLCGNMRASKEGERVLYLGEAITTCLLECNANRGETFSIGEFQPREKMIIYDFIASEDDCNQLWLSSIFSQVTQQTDYIKAQTLAHLVKSLKCDGVKYRSAKEDEGVCYAIFYPEKFECTRSYLVRLNSVSISFEE
ncbi:MAG TPA: hypothetical protein DDY77_03765 [Clostridiales bacterium]|mgnify:CR=1 FL=1|nr:hypothetical protein [Clostridiales bacterium]